MCVARVVLLLLLVSIGSIGGAALDCSAPSAEAAAALAEPDAARAALVYASHAHCAASPSCRRRFGLWEGGGGGGSGGTPDAAFDWRFFALLIDQLVDELRADGAAVTAALCGNATGVATDGAALLWGVVLDNYSFCTENEVPDAVAGCVCRRDKVCHETPAEDYAYERGTLALVVLAFFAAIMYYGPRALLDIAELRRAIDCGVACAACSGLRRADETQQQQQPPPPQRPQPARWVCPAPPEPEIGLAVPEAALRSVSIDLGGGAAGDTQRGGGPGAWTAQRGAAPRRWAGGAGDTQRGGGAVAVLVAPSATLDGLGLGAGRV